MQTQGQRNKEDPEKSDSVLVQQALSGDQEAFEVLVSRYQQALRKHMLVAQEVQATITRDGEEPGLDLHR